MNIYIFQLTNGYRTFVDLELDPIDVEHNLKNGTWFVSEEGFYINPAHVVHFVPPKEGE